MTRVEIKIELLILFKLVVTLWEKILTFLFTNGIKKIRTIVGLYERGLLTLYP